MTRLEQQMNFIVEVDKLKRIVRRSYLTDGSRKENDAEHSWHLAMMAVILADHFEGVDILKVIKMVLIHDLVEIHAGDTFLYDEEGNRNKAERERQAAEKIFPILPPDQSVEYRALWDEFEEKKTPESVCAGVLDRLEPLVLNVCAGGKTWQEHGIVPEQVLEANQVILNEAPVEIAAYTRALLREAADRNLFRIEDPEGKQ